MVMDIFGALLGHLLNNESFECGRLCFFVIPQQRPFYINQCWVGIRKHVRTEQGFKPILHLKLLGYHIE
jgi:hypothetical protein